MDTPTIKSVFSLFPLQNVQSWRTKRRGNGMSWRGAAVVKRGGVGKCEKEEQPSLTNCLRLLDGDIDTLSDIVVVVVRYSSSGWSIFDLRGPTWAPVTHSRFWNHSAAAKAATAADRTQNFQPLIFFLPHFFTREIYCDLAHDTLRTIFCAPRGSATQQRALPNLHHRKPHWNRELWKLPPCACINNFPVLFTDFFLLSISFFPL